MCLNMGLNVVPIQVARHPESCTPQLTSPGLSSRNDEADKNYLAYLDTFQRKLERVFEPRAVEHCFVLC